MAKLKAVDFLARSSEDQAAESIILLTGEDLLLKEVVIESFARSAGMWPDLVERLEILDARNLLGEWREGSLMGPRFLKVSTPGKLKNPSALLELAQNTEDKMAIVPNAAWQGTSQLEFAKRSCEIECKEVKSSKEKQKLIKVRAKQLGLDLSDDMLKAIADRIDSTEDLEITVTTLILLSRTSQELNVKDVTAVAGDPVKYRDTTRSILMGNTARLTADILDGDPLPTLVTGINVLIKLYSWLIEEGGEEEESKALDRLKIHKRHAKLWKDVRKKFSPQLIRSVLDKWVSVYQEIRIGDDTAWREKLRISILGLNPKQ